MRILGLDLAGKPKHPTGICLMHDSDTIFRVVYTDDGIIKIIDDFRPDVIAIDAPLIKGEIRVREVDLKLKRYGALPPTLPGMMDLVERGRCILAKLRGRYQVIEVFPTATAKILKIYNKDYKRTMEMLGLKNISSKHELDAYLCCLTARMHLEGKTISIADTDSVVIIPKESII